MKRVKAKILVELEADFYDNESSEETLRYCVEQDLEDMKYSIYNVDLYGTYKIITLCGSTKFKEEFIKCQKELTLAGNIVLTVGLFGHSGDNEAWIDSNKEMLEDMQLKRIDMSDEVFVINVGGYIGESTEKEIKYAKKNGKIIKYLEPLK